jgi:glycerophosphoryl diester phosphodiesterase
VVDVLRRADALTAAMAWSFDLDTVAAVRRLEPRLPAALLTPPVSAPGPMLETALMSDLAGIAMRHDGVDAALVRAARLRGLSVYAWTADEPEEQRRLVACGVHAIASDTPALLQQTLAASTD